MNYQWMLNYCYLTALLYILILECEEVWGSCQQVVENCQVKPCVRRSSSSNSLQYICKSPRIAESKNKVGVHFMLESPFIFQGIIIVPGLCSILKMYLAWGCFCHMFAVQHFFPFSLRTKLLDSSMRVMVSRCSGESSDCSQSHHEVRTRLCLLERGFCTF